MMKEIALGALSPTAKYEKTKRLEKNTASCRKRESRKKKGKKNKRIKKKKWWW